MPVVAAIERYIASVLATVLKFMHKGAAGIGFDEIGTRSLLVTRVVVGA